MDRIKIYGERNSGTNYLEELLELNTFSEVIRLDAPKVLTYPLKKIERVTDWLIKWKQPSVLGWKHGIPPVKAINQAARNHSLKVISITKNPYSFLLSFHKRPYHFRQRAEDFNQFLIEDFLVLPRDNFRSKARRNPIQLWNEKNKMFLGLKSQVNCPCVHITYEQLLQNPEQMYSYLVEALGLQTVSTGFKNIDKSTKDDSTLFNDYKEYYLKEKWKDKLSPEAIKIINKYLDKELMKSLGYTVL